MNQEGLLGRAQAYFAAMPDPRDAVALREALRLGRAVCRYAADDGVLLHMGTAGSSLLSARDAASAARIVEEFSVWEGVKGTVTLTSADQAVEAGFDAAHDVLRHQLCVYERLDPVPLAGTLRIAPLTEADAPTVVAHYHNIPEESVRRHIADGWVFGGYDAAGNLVGFVGEHDEGAIGMLVVLPDQRRRGYAFELEGWLVNRHLAAGRTPYCQVVLDNAASFALQRKLGMTVLPTVQCWML